MKPRFSLVKREGYEVDLHAMIFYIHIHCDVFISLDSTPKDEISTFRISFPKRSTKTKKKLLYRLVDFAKRGENIFQNFWNF